ncbi:hypothetical protein HKX48_004158 [Thoreauomyces humboldtii]|nr:hypothetical protein HKX48_004158 [Thoreauomyces humboldtii]
MEARASVAQQTETRMEARASVVVKLTTELEEATKKAQALQSKLAATQHDLQQAKCQAEIQAIATRAQALVSTRIDLERKFAAAQADKRQTELEAENDALVAGIAGTEAKLNELNVKLLSMEARDGKHQALIADLEDSCNTLMDELREAQRKTLVAERLRRAEGDKLEDARQEVDGLRVHLRTLRSRDPRDWTAERVGRPRDACEQEPPLTQIGQARSTVDRETPNADDVLNRDDVKDQLTLNSHQEADSSSDSESEVVYYEAKEDYR